LDGLAEGGRTFAEETITGLQQALTFEEGEKLLGWVEPMSIGVGEAQGHAELLKSYFEKMPPDVQAVYGSVDELVKQGLNPAYLAARGIFDNLEKIDGRHIEVFIDYITSGTPPKEGPPKRALGGHVMPGETIIGGEGHPELFTPSVSGNIVPNPSSSHIGGGMTSSRVIEQLETNNQLLSQLIIIVSDLGTSEDTAQAVKEAYQFASV
jgi:hypothetical protein